MSSMNYFLPQQQQPVSSGYNYYNQVMQPNQQATPYKTGYNVPQQQVQTSAPYKSAVNTNALNTSGMDYLSNSVDPRAVSWDSQSTMFDSKDFNANSGVNGLQYTQPPEAGSYFTMDNIASGVGALTGVGNLYLANQALDEQKKMNEHSIGMANTNLYNSGTSYNTQLGNKAVTAAGMQATGTPEERAASASAYVAANKVKTSI